MVTPLPLSPPSLLQGRLQHICGEFLGWDSSLPAPLHPIPSNLRVPQGASLWPVQEQRRQLELSGIHTFSLGGIWQVPRIPVPQTSLMASSSFHHRALCGAADPPH